MSATPSSCSTATCMVCTVAVSFCGRDVCDRRPGRAGRDCAAAAADDDVAGAHRLVAAWCTSPTSHAGSSTVKPRHSRESSSGSAILGVARRRVRANACGSNGPVLTDGTVGAQAPSAAYSAFGFVRSTPKRGRPGGGGPRRLRTVGWCSQARGDEAPVQSARPPGGANGGGKLGDKPVASKIVHEQSFQRRARRARMGSHAHPHNLQDRGRLRAWTVPSPFPGRHASRALRRVRRGPSRKTWWHVRTRAHGRGTYDAMAPWTQCDLGDRLGRHEWEGHVDVGGPQWRRRRHGG